MNQSRSNDVRAQLLRIVGAVVADTDFREITWLRLFPARPRVRGPLAAPVFVRLLRRAAKCGQRNYCKLADSTPRLTRSRFGI